VVTPRLFAAGFGPDQTPPVVHLIALVEDQVNFEEPIALGVAMSVTIGVGEVQRDLVSVDWKSCPDFCCQASRL
jgi:hypothetical protein